MIPVCLIIFTSPGPVIQRLIEPMEKLSSFLTYLPIAAEITSLLAAFLIAIVYMKKQRLLENKFDLIELKKARINIQEEVSFVIAVFFGLAFIGALLIFL